MKHWRKFQRYLVWCGRPMVILLKGILEIITSWYLEWLTRSSSSSASLLNLLTKPLSPRPPALASMSKGLNFASNAVSIKTIRGYAIGTPEVYVSRNSSSSVVWELIYQLEPQRVPQFAEDPVIVQTLSDIPEDCILDSSFVPLWYEIWNWKPGHEGDVFTGNPLEGSRSADQGRPRTNGMAKGCKAQRRQWSKICLNVY